MAPEGIAMKLSGLSPDAHGVLLALQDLDHIKLSDASIANELVERGYAVIEGDTLYVTADGIALRPFEVIAPHS